MAGASAGLQLFSQSLFSPPADAPELVAACPTIDLTAAAGGGNVVYVWRRGGEVVSKLSERNKTVQALAWKADGQYLAIAWSDGVVRLVGLESPKAVHQIRLFEGEPLAIDFISWSKNLVGMPGSWQAGMLQSLGEGESKDLLGLPRTLLFLEAEDDLSKLPPLPVSGGSGDDMFVFSTRTSLEFMFPALQPSDSDAIHIMMLGAVDGAIHVCIYDTFLMGTFRVPLPPRPAAEPAEQPLLRLRAHANHPASSTHALLLSNRDEDANAIYLVPMDFSFVFSSPLNLSLLDYKTTTFQKLLRYIKQTQIHMQGEWQAARELPARFLAGIQEDLQGEPRCKTIDHALRVAVLTGYVAPTLKTWLVDTIAERGHKRWDKTVVSGLENLRDLLHENMLPALDRASLALARLHGLAAFHDTEDIGFTADGIMRLINMVSCLIIASQSALARVTAELELFMAFSTWLRLIIERLALPAQAEEQADKEPPVNVTAVLDYVTNHLLASPVDLHFGKSAADDWEADWKAVERADPASSLVDQLEAELEKVDQIGTREGSSLALMPKKRRKRRDGEQPTDAAGEAEEAEMSEEEDPAASATYMKAFLTFEFLTKLFATHADRTLKEIAESGRRHVHFGPLTRLDLGAPVRQAAVAMTALLKADLEESADALVFTAAMAGVPAQSFHLFRMAVSTSGGLCTAVATQACLFALGIGGSIADIRFLRTDLVLVLWVWDTDRPPRLIAIPVQSPEITYTDYHDDGFAPHAQAIRLDQDAPSPGVPLWTANVPVPSGSSSSNSSPVVRMEVLGPRDSDDGSGMPARVNLLHVDGATYETLALPSMAAMFG